MILRFIILSFFLINNSYAADNLVKTNIKSEIIKVIKDKNIIEFKKNVILTRDDLSFLSDKMTVFTNEKSTINNNSIEFIKAKGNVKIFNEEFVATGNSGFYDVKNNIFKIFGNVILNEGTKIAYGEEFTYDINSANGFLSSNNVNDSDNKTRSTIIINEDLNNLKKEMNENSNN